MVTRSLRDLLGHCASRRSLQRAKLSSVGSEALAESGVQALRAMTGETMGLKDDGLESSYMRVVARSLLTGLSFMRQRVGVVSYPGAHQRPGGLMQRTVQYWRLVKRDGSALDGNFPADEVVNELRGAERRRRDRHRHCRDGMILIAHGVRASPPMLILDKVRHDNLPSIGDAGGLRRAIGLSDGEGLLEPSYFMFTTDNVVAMLMSGNGPRAKRLCDYLNAKLGVDVGLDPILTQDLDRVLDVMRVSSVDIAVPSTRIDRDLVGGDWAEALEANRVLAQDGVVKVGVAVGRRGTRYQKDQRRLHIRRLIDQLRGSGAITEMQSARVTGTVSGSQRSVDLLADHFVERTEVDADRLAHPDRSATYAHGLLEESVAGNVRYLTEVVPRVEGRDTNLTPQFVDRPEDERNR